MLGCVSRTASRAFAEAPEQPNARSEGPAGARTTASPHAARRAAATAARWSPPVLILDSMGTSSYVLAGVPGGGAFASTCHGASRMMSRQQASRSITGAELRRQLEHRASRCVAPLNAGPAEETRRRKRMPPRLSRQPRARRCQKLTRLVPARCCQRLAAEVNRGACRPAHRRATGAAAPAYANSTEG